MNTTAGYMALCGHQFPPKPFLTSNHWTRTLHAIAFFKNSMTSKLIGGDRPYIERLLAIRTELEQLGYVIPDFVYFDICMIGIFAKYREFLQNRMD
ncbi:hypothetical protein VTO42DRAFT_2642 [Malbranchea cinnamomea]